MDYGCHISLSRDRIKTRVDSERMPGKNVAAVSRECRSLEKEKQELILDKVSRRIIRAFDYQRVLPREL